MGAGRRQDVRQVDEYPAGGRGGREDGGQEAPVAAPEVQDPPRPRETEDTRNRVEDGVPGLHHPLEAGRGPRIAGQMGDQRHAVGHPGVPVVSASSTSPQAR
ncbi:hypothetical protein PV371_26995 [Streptomyces sp. TX20-6-3]|nr:hypothetical protein [Streptomyces sp. TX20-6-3]MDX2563282.1 hypothetical protein [Streptomyces sp. TX20-6-3]